ncbi:hypothetical protein [Halopiger aswanensis]|uniref:Uncharacterized protein n=1 Tax=Halopiger aswanensis TaxID=148449 RepID=A0A3R7FSP7_9EURY|nr:hypothetical protein [Halopiger aswanensis]RKD86243.1 hypothetical protein ATJ93_4660 [Halopiger aswanensis]
MTERDTPSPERIERVVESITSEAAWVREPSALSPAEAVATAASDSTDRAELFFTHRCTQARLELVAPSRTSDGVCDLLVRQPLDPGLRATDGDFLAELERAHATIARRNAHEFTEPVEDQSMLLRATVPRRFEPDEVDALLASIGMTVAQVDDLHERIRRPVEQIVSETEHPSRS